MMRHLRYAMFVHIALCVLHLPWCNVDVPAPREALFTTEATPLISLKEQ